MSDQKPPSRNYPYGMPPNSAARDMRYLQPSNGYTINQLQNIVHGWANEQFPHREPSIAWMKLFEELGEVIRKPDDPMEWADVIILVLDLAAIYGVKLEGAVLEKMDINRRRLWTTSPTGVMTHVPEDAP